ncbi:MAG: HD domain-containing protein [Myxococcota bacterium]|nr:HD domain-containing protein [Myxococcota bacterium]
MLDHGWETNAPEAVRSICRSLKAAGFEAYVVGGGPRDLALGRPVAEWDVATSAPPDEVARLFPRTFPTGIAHGTVTVVHGGARVEVTTFRGDGAYLDGRHPASVRFVRDVREDLARRDFTVNAVAGDPETGAIVDPFGGLADLRDRTIRAVGDPDARFDEDGLRPLRAARFAAVLGFEFDPATRAALGRHLETFRKVSAERVRDELAKMLEGADRPSVGLRVLAECGLLAEIVEPLARAAGFEQNRHHEFDLSEHTLRAVDAAPRRLAARLAALLHDLGKLERRAWSAEKADHVFIGHEEESARVADEWLRRMRFPNDLRERVVALVRRHGAYYDDSWTDAAVRRWMRRVGADRIDDQLDLLEADVAAKGRRPDVPAALEGVRRLRERVARQLAARPALTTEHLAIDGDAVMRIAGIGPGPRVGEIKRALLEVVTDDPSCNTPAALEAIVRERWAGGGADG